MYEADQLLRLFEARMEELGMTQVELGTKAFGKADNTAIQSMRRGSVPAIDRVAAMAAALGMEVYVGMPRATSFSAESADTDIVRPDGLQGGYLPVPWHPAMQEKGVSPIALQSSWIAAQGLAPNNLRAITPKESLLPFAVAKSTVAVVLANAPQKGVGGIWCFQEGGSIGIARTMFVDGIPILLPKNDREEARFLNSIDGQPSGLLGKVVWLGTAT